MYQGYHPVFSRIPEIFSSLLRPNQRFFDLPFLKADIQLLYGLAQEQAFYKLWTIHFIKARSVYPINGTRSKGNCLMAIARP
jgi:hypothetical protein